MMTKWLILATILLLSICVQPEAQAQSGPCPGGAPLAFEGAEGYGRCSQGGRGGVVVDVTNLNNSGAGSLRECAEVLNGPRTCRIMVAGTVSLGGFDITIRNPYITIDGSNYPMALKDGGISVRASHSIIRHLRIRPGYMSVQTRGANSNGLSYMSNETGGQTTDHIADHVSVSWTTDDSVNVIYGTQRVTIQDSLIYEGLLSGGNCGICSSKGILLGTGTNSPETVSVYRTLNAHNFLRFPQVSSGNVDFVNNVDYNSSGSSAQIVPYYQRVLINMVNNYWKDGLSGEEYNNGLNLGYNVIRTMGSFTYSPQSGIYVSGNLSVGKLGTETLPRHCNLTEPATCIIWGDNGGIAVQPSRYEYETVGTLLTAQQAFDAVLDHSGAFPRDSADARVTADVRNGTGRWISEPSTVGGWPVLTGGSPPPPSPPPPPVAYSLSAPASVTPGSVFDVQWTAPADHATNDWIGIYPASQPSSDGTGVTWKYIPAGTSGTLQFTAYATEGAYQIRAFPNGNNSPELANIPLQIASSVPPPPPPPPAMQCGDGLDNDGDAKIDLADPGCTDANDDSESPDPQTIEQRVAALESAVATIQAQLASYVSIHGGFTQRLDGHDALLASIGGQLGSLGSLLTTAQGQISELTGLLSVVNATVLNHGTVLDSHETSLSSLQMNLTALQSTVASIQSKLTAMCQALGGGC